MFCLVNLLSPFYSTNIESIFLVALALEGAWRPKLALAAATLSQSEAEEDHAFQHTARALLPPRSAGRG